jgi:glucosamine--fructose-6-phosphate aminotransferase (isomerizing)
MTQPTQSTMLAEALSIPAVVAAALDRHGAQIADAARAIRAFEPVFAVTIARGTSDHAAEYLCRLLGRHLGLMVASLSPSLVTVHQAPLRLDRALTVAISQSGGSPDVVEPVKAARQAGSLTVALVNATDSALAGAAEIVIPIDAGPERAVAATKSFVMSLVQALRLTEALAPGAAPGLERLPLALEQAVRCDWSSAIPWLRPLPSLLVVGRGYGLPIAREMALKLKELAGLHAEAVSGAEIMHGPKALIDPEMPVLAVAAEDGARASMDATMAELSRLTARLIAVGPPSEHAALSLPAGPLLAPELAGLATIAAFFPFAAALAQARGLSPDAPRNLAKVTRTL